MRTMSHYLLIATVMLSLDAPVFGGQAPAQAPPPPPQPSPTAPLYQHKGEQYRIYNFPGTGESIPYRLFVPSKWTPDIKLPMLVTLRAGNTVDGPYRAQNDLVKHAEQRGYIVVTPMGYRPLSQPYYGSAYQIARPNAAAPAAGWTAQENERAEQDVLRELISGENTPLSDEELSRRLPDLHVFGRVTPDDKLRLVGLLQAKGAIVAMTGDAVNAASRLEALTKDFSCQLIVSHTVAELAGLSLDSYPTREVSLRGRREPLAVRIIEDAATLPVI